KSKEEALKVFREIQDRSFWFGEILSGYGHTLGQAGRNAEAEKALKEASDVAREIHNQGLIAQTLNFLGDNAAYRGDIKAAGSAFEQALKEALRTSDQQLTLVSKANVAKALVIERRGGASDTSVQPAIEALREVEREADRLGFKSLSLECT